jgi:hypothetical protein
MVADLNIAEVYCSILTLENVGTVVNYGSIFKTLIPGVNTRIMRISTGAGFCLSR